MDFTPPDALRGAQWYLDAQRYVAARLAPDAVTAAAAILAEQDRPFHALIVDKDEVTLIAPLDLLEITAQRFASITRSGLVYRLITLDTELPPEAVGILATLTRSLAQAGIPILALSAFSRDHLFVPEDRADEALSLLRALTEG
jgi:hypothetical protein